MDLNEQQLTVIIAALYELWSVSPSEATTGRIQRLVASLGGDPTGVYFEPSSDGYRVKNLDQLARFKGDYEHYRSSPEWRHRREAATRRAAGRCQVCNASAPLEVHHRTYDRLGEEWPIDLTVLCTPCHRGFHDSGRQLQNGAPNSQIPAEARNSESPF